MLQCVCSEIIDVKMWLEQPMACATFFSILPQVLNMSEQTQANVDSRFLRISASESTRVYVDDTLDGNRPVFL